MFPQLIEAYDTDLAGAIAFTGVCILVLGFSSFIWYVSTESCRSIVQIEFDANLV